MEHEQSNSLLRLMETGPAVVSGGAFTRGVSPDTPGESELRDCIHPVHLVHDRAGRFRIHPSSCHVVSYQTSVTCSSITHTHPLQCKLGATQKPSRSGGRPPRSAASSDPTLPILYLDFAMSFPKPLRATCTLSSFVSSSNSIARRRHHPIPSPRLMGLACSA